MNLEHWIRKLAVVHRSAGRPLFGGGQSAPFGRGRLGDSPVQPVIGPAGSRFQTETKVFPSGAKEHPGCSQTSQTVSVIMSIYHERRAQRVNDFLPDALANKPANAGRLRELYQRWGFKGMLAALEESPREQQAVLI